MYHRHTHCYCDGKDCNTSVVIWDVGSDIPKTLRALGWAVARDRHTIYCPNCKPLYTNVGCRGGRKSKLIL